MLETYEVILWGSLSGLALGLTGGGGSIIAVPILVYGLGSSVHDAIAISLFSVAVTTLFGSLQNFIGRDPNLDWKAGLILSLAGVVLAPVGAIAGTYFSPTVLMGIFSILMLVIGIKMWLKVSSRKTAASEKSAEPKSKRPYKALIGGGVATGFVSGFLGVGGGFLIVPALVAAGLSIRKSVTTSLLAIFIVSTAGAASHFIQNPALNIYEGIEFAIGGVLGLNVGMAFVKRLSAEWIQRLFAVFVIVIAVTMFFEKVNLTEINGIIKLFVNFIETTT